MTPFKTPRLGFASNRYHQKRTALALEWYARGEANLLAKDSRRAIRAIDDFRTALVYSPENDLYRLHLAEALMAAGRLDEARTYRSAERYLGRAVAEDPNNAQARSRLSIARLVLASDPFIRLVKFY